MTHYDNYARDRIVLYLFDSVFSFARAWTNIELISAPIDQAFVHYLKFNPLDRKLPIQGDPCADKKHLLLWPEKMCQEENYRLPGAVIVGPQKSGTHIFHVRIRLLYF